MKSVDCYGLSPSKSGKTAISAICIVAVRTDAGHRRLIDTFIQDFFCAVKGEVGPEKTDHFEEERASGAGGRQRLLKRDKKDVDPFSFCLIRQKLPMTTEKTLTQKKEKCYH